MRNHDIERWVLDIADRVSSNQPIEDSKVELKREWILPEDAARGMAGHANAARGESILWLIGIDQKQGTVIGANYEELSNWWNKVKSYFDELSPTLTDLNVPYKGKTIVALLLDTKRAPFVVVNPKFGQVNGHSIAKEVPWREGTSIRSANRSDLIRLLSPIQSKPEIEILDGQVFVQEYNQGRPEQKSIWHFRITIYITLHNDTQVIIPFHKCEASFEIQDKAEIYPLNTNRILLKSISSPLIKSQPGEFDHDPLNVENTNNEIIIYATTRFYLETEADFLGLESKNFVNKQIAFSAKLVPAGSDIKMPIEIKLKYIPKKERDAGYTWTLIK